MLIAGNGLLYSALQRSSKVRLVQYCKMTDGWQDYIGDIKQPSLVRSMTFRDF